jgi:UDPglucose 6-dehydrogenase
MRLTILGAGYVGLVTGAGLADLGHDVLVVDIDAAKVLKLRAGEVPIYEPGLADLVKRNVRSGRLAFATMISPLHVNDEIYFIAVGTPPAADGSADLSFVLSAADAIAAAAKEPAVVVIKSTVPVGTCDRVQRHLAEVSGVTLEVASNPEFLKEGDALADFFKPDRVVIGARSDEARATLRQLYAPLQLSGERSLVVTDPRSSELIKYAANAMLAARISFMNELAQLCHASGANVHDVRLGVGSDTRIGKKFLYAGPGYGGSCFPKDVQALAATGRAHGVRMRVAEAAHEANEAQADFIVRLITDAFGGDVSGKKIALWGLAFKPETDDVRESPAQKIAHALLNRGADIIGHDPEGAANFARLFEVEGRRVTIAANQYDAIDGAHALVLLTEWRCYRAPNFHEIARRFAGDERHLPLVLDARNVWRRAEVEATGLRYQGVGTAPAT